MRPRWCGLRGPGTGPGPCHLRNGLRGSQRSTGPDRDHLLLPRSPWTNCSGPWPQRQGALGLVSQALRRRGLPGPLQAPRPPPLPTEPGRNWAWGWITQGSVVHLWVPLGDSRPQRRRSLPRLQGTPGWAC